ncbi:MAG TPA: acyl-CoA dehydrogenase family protein [Microvirga sp.]|nr:acyl-CoA dehydrogenase family protein [Microvirga sp.]
MQFGLTDEEEMIRDTARRIAADRLAPVAERLDRGESRAELLANLKELARNGFMTLNVESRYGGTEAGTVAFALAIEELGYACASTAVATSVTNMVGEVIQAVGSAEHKEIHLPRLADGTYPAGAFCLTESGAGSDPSSMKTRARRDGDSFVLDGSKIYITSAEFAGIFIVWAVTDPNAPKGRGISLFLVERGTPGLVVGPAEKKMGQHGSPTNAVHFDGCRVPASALVGRENDGFRVAVGELAGGRIGVAALSLGIARAAMDAATTYAKSRQQFGGPIADFQGIQWMIADREVDLEAARLLILKAAYLKDRGESFAKAASMAKLFASEAAHRATDTAIQLHGGAGYCGDFPVERYARDARITRIYEGTSEIQRLIIARETLRQVA